MPSGEVNDMRSADAYQHVSSEQEAQLSLEAELAVEFASGAVEGAAGLLHQDFECLGNEVTKRLADHSSGATGILKGAAFTTGAARAVADRSLSLSTEPEPTLAMSKHTQAAEPASEVAAARARRSTANAAARAAVTAARWTAQLQAPSEQLGCTGAMPADNPSEQRGEASQASRIACRQPLAGSICTTTTGQRNGTNARDELRAGGEKLEGDESAAGTVNEQCLGLLRSLPPGDVDELELSEAPLAEEVTALTRHGGDGSISNLAGASKPPACEAISDHHGMVAERVLELELARSAFGELPQQRRASLRCRSAEPQRPRMPIVAADIGAIGRGQAAPVTTDLAAATDTVAIGQAAPVRSNLAADGSHQNLGMQPAAAGAGAVELTQAAPVTTVIATADQPAAESLRHGKVAAARTVKLELRVQFGAENAGETAGEGSTSTEAKLLQGQQEGMPESGNGATGQEGVLPARAAPEPQPLDICSERSVGIDQGKQTVAAPVEGADLSAAPPCAAPETSGNARSSDAQPKPSAKEGSLVPKGEQAGREVQKPTEEPVSAAKGTEQDEAFTPGAWAGSLAAILAAPRKQSSQCADGRGQEMICRAAIEEASVARTFIPKLEASASSAHPTEVAVACESKSLSGACGSPAAADADKPSTVSVSGSLTEPAIRRSRSSPDLQPPLQQVSRLPVPPSFLGVSNTPPGFKTTAATSVFAGHKSHDSIAYLRLSHPQQPSRIPRPTANLSNRLPGSFREPSVAATAGMAVPPPAVPRQSGIPERSASATAEKGGPPPMLPKGVSKPETGPARAALKIPFQSLPGIQPAAALEAALLPQPADAWQMLADKLSAAMAGALGNSAEVAQSHAAALPAPKGGAKAAAVVVAAASTPPAEAKWKLPGQLSGLGTDTADVAVSMPMQGNAAWPAECLTQLPSLEELCTSYDVAKVRRLRACVKASDAGVSAPILFPVNAPDRQSRKEMPLEELRSLHKAAKARRLKACLKAIDAGVPPSIVCPGKSPEQISTELAALSFDLHASSIHRHAIPKDIAFSRSPQAPAQSPRPAQHLQQSCEEDRQRASPKDVTFPRSPQAPAQSPSPAKHAQSPEKEGTSSAAEAGAMSGNTAASLAFAKHSAWLRIPVGQKTDLRFSAVNPHLPGRQLTEAAKPAKRRRNTASLQDSAFKPGSQGKFLDDTGSGLVPPPKGSGPTFKPQALSPELLSPRSRPALAQPWPTGSPAQPLSTSAQQPSEFSELVDLDPAPPTISLEEVLADTLGLEAGSDCCGAANSGQGEERGSCLLITDSEASGELPLGIPSRSLGRTGFPGVLDGHTADAPTEMKAPGSQGLGTGTSAAANEIVEDLVRPAVLVDTGKAGWREARQESLVTASGEFAEPVGGTGEASLEASASSESESDTDRGFESTAGLRPQTKVLTVLGVLVVASVLSLNSFQVLDSAAQWSPPPT